MVGDYEDTSVSLTLDSSTTSLQVSVPIVDDSSSEDTETFNVTLMVDIMNSTFNETANVSLNPGSATVFVQDNDSELRDLFLLVLPLKLFPLPPSPPPPLSPHLQMSNSHSAQLRTVVLRETW